MATPFIGEEPPQEEIIGPWRPGREWQDHPEIEYQRKIADLIPPDLTEEEEAWVTSSIRRYDARYGRLPSRSETAGMVNIFRGELIKLENAQQVIYDEEGNVIDEGEPEDFLGGGVGPDGEPISANYLRQGARAQEQIDFLGGPAPGPDEIRYIRGAISKEEEDKADFLKHIEGGGDPNTFRTRSQIETQEKEQTELDEQVENVISRLEEEYIYPELTPEEIDLRRQSRELYMGQAFDQEVEGSGFGLEEDQRVQRAQIDAQMAESGNWGTPLHYDAIRRLDEEFNRIRQTYDLDISARDMQNRQSVDSAKRDAIRRAIEQGEQAGYSEASQGRLLDFQSDLAQSQFQNDRELAELEAKGNLYSTGGNVLGQLTSAYLLSNAMRGGRDRGPGVFGRIRNAITSRVGGTGGYGGDEWISAGIPASNMAASAAPSLSLYAPGGAAAAGVSSVAPGVAGYTGGYGAASGAAGGAASTPGIWSSTGGGAAAGGVPWFVPAAMAVGAYQIPAVRRGVKSVSRRVSDAVKDLFGR